MRRASSAAPLLVEVPGRGVPVHDSRRGPGLSAEGERARQMLEGVLGIPFTSGNRIRVLRNGVEYFPAMLEAIRSAESSIEFLTYVYWQGEIARTFADALSDRARAGVKVRVLLDGVGSIPMDRSLVTDMREAGVRVEYFRPVSWQMWRNNRRTHRKVLVCDGKTGFTGGVGIAEEWEGDARDPSEWRDSHFLIEGPAVHGLRAAFIGNWLEDGRHWKPEEERICEHGQPGDALVQLVRSTASFGWSDIATLLRTMVYLAERRLRITAAYFVPDPAMLELLLEAARRGVHVQILTAGPHTDARVSQAAGDYVMSRLLAANIEVWHYMPTTLHAKIIVVDDTVACIGSANFNQRSMRRDDETALVVMEEGVISRLHADFERDLRVSQRITLAAWRSRSWWSRFTELLSRLIWRQV